MKRGFTVAVVVAFSMLAMSLRSGQAGPLDAKQVPAGAKWVLHLNVDVLRDSPIGKSIYARLQDNDAAMRKVDELEAVSGMRFPEDLHGVTLYGTDASPDHAIAIFDAVVDQDRLLDIVRVGTEMRSSKHGNHDVLSWNDKGQQRFGSFHTPQRIVMGQSDAAVKQALDALDGKTGAIPADASLLAGNDPKLLMYIGATDLLQLKQTGLAKSPLVGQLEEGWIAAGQDGENLKLMASAVATSPETAEQLKSALEGIRSMLQLAGNDANAGPKQRVGAQAFNNLTATTTGKTLNINWSIPITVADQAMDLGGKNPSTRP